MPYNLLIFPLLGGFLFIHTYKPLHYTSKRLEGYRLLIYSSLAGVILLVVSVIFVGFVNASYPKVLHWWKQWVPFDYSGVAIFSFILGWVIAKLLNIRFLSDERHQKMLRKIIQRHGNLLEILIDKALNESKQISITLKNQKVYIGYIISLLDPATMPLSFIEILPTISGHRNQNTKQFELTTNYAKVYDQIYLAEDEQPLITNLNIHDFKIVIPVSEIVSANIFDKDAYTFFRNV